MFWTAAVLLAWHSYRCSSYTLRCRIIIIIFLPEWCSSTPACHFHLESAAKSLRLVLLRESLEVEDFTSLRSLLSFIEPEQRECVEHYQLKVAQPEAWQLKLQEVMLLSMFVYHLDEMLKSSQKYYAIFLPYLPMYAWIFALCTSFSLRKHSQDHLFGNHRWNIAVGFSPSLRDSAVNILQLLVFFCTWPLGSFVSFFFPLFFLHSSMPRREKDGLWLFWGDRVIFMHYHNTLPLIYISTVH